MKHALLCLLLLACESEELELGIIINPNRSELYSLEEAKAIVAEAKATAAARQYPTFPARRSETQTSGNRFDSVDEPCTGYNEVWVRVPCESAGLDDSPMRNAIGECTKPKCGIEACASEDELVNGNMPWTVRFTPCTRKQKRQLRDAERLDAMEHVE